MIDFEKQFGRPEYAGRNHAEGQIQIAKTFKLVYGWMAAGLALSGVVAWYTAISGLWQRVLIGPGMFVCIIVELALVFVLSGAINKIPVIAAYGLFAAYAMLNGLTLSVVFIAYEIALVQRVFFITAATFGGLALYGTFTKSDLASVGSICGMALWGLVIASLVNIFLKSSGLDWVVTFAGVIIFTGLTMYDAQKIKVMAANEGMMSGEVVRRVAIMGALTMYLDFINLFLYLLKLLGNKNRR